MFPCVVSHDQYRIEGYQITGLVHRNEGCGVQGPHCGVGEFVEDPIEIVHFADLITRYQATIQSGMSVNGFNFQQRCALGLFGRRGASKHP